MRTDKNNPSKVAVIIDHVGNVYRHGLPDEDRGIVLRKQKKTVSREISLKQCPKCYGAHRPQATCPYYDHVYQVAEESE